MDTLCLVLWQSVALAKKNSGPAFRHFGALGVRNAVEAKHVLPLASQGLLLHDTK